MRVRPAAFLILALAARPVPACQICFPLPKKSIADRLIEAKPAVLAREDPQRPFHYRATEILKGAAPARPLDLFLDSGTRRLLRIFPDRSVLLARSGAQWRRLAMVDAEVLPVVRHVLERGTKWPPRERVDYFAKLFGREHATLRDLAHLEIARAPYADIRRIGRGVPMKLVRASLADGRYMEWWALHILLLAQSDDPDDKRRIRETARSLVPPLHLGAWATAYVEIDGAAAIGFLEDLYFRGAPRVEQLREIALALSVQGSGGRAGLRDRIVASYRVLLDRHPALASAVLDDLLAWERRDMVPFMREFAKNRGRALMPDARLKLQRFLALGR
jgi:hypothetical protein